MHPIRKIQLALGILLLIVLILAGALILIALR